MRARRINFGLACLSALLWGVATWTGWVNSIIFVSHISMATMVWTGVAAWRADVPDKES